MSKAPRPNAKPDNLKQQVSGFLPNLRSEVNLRYTIVKCLAWAQAYPNWDEIFNEMLTFPNRYNTTSDWNAKNKILFTIEREKKVEKEREKGENHVKTDHAQGCFNSNIEP